MAMARTKKARRADLDPALPAPVESLRRAAAALADRRRCRLLYELRRGPCAVHELVERTGLPQPLVSHHLGVLRRAGLVRDLPDGRLRRYYLEPDAPPAARALLDLLRNEMRETTEPAWAVEVSTPRHPVRPEQNKAVRSEMEDYLL